jgi:hypothetical protein
VIAKALRRSGGNHLSPTAFQASYYEASCDPGQPVRSTPGKLYRDSSGRIRIDHYVEIGSETFCLFRKIYDPAKNAMFVLNDTKRTILVLRHPPGSQATVIALPPVRDAGTSPTTEPLGSREIEGLLCQGYRLGAGYEYWTSEELGGIPILATEDGEVRMRICEIMLAEPDRHLFAIPADYEIQEEHGPE